MGFDRAAAVLEGVEQAPSFGVAAAPVSVDLGAPGTVEGIAHSRLRAARSWLFALGYLDRDDESAGYDAPLIAGVRVFQREAGLTVDGWIGEGQTWPRLQELVAFEHPLDPAFWDAGHGVPKRALERALATRLRVYGIDVARFGGLDEAVRTLFATLSDLGAPAESLGLSRTIWLAGVLDHDRHLAAVAAGALSGRARAVLTRSDDDPQATAAMGVLLNMAKVELWLAQGARTRLGDVLIARRGMDGRWVLPSAIRLDMKAYIDWLDEEHAGAAGARRAYRAGVRRGASDVALAHFLDATRRFGSADDPFAPKRLAQLDDFYGGASNRRRQRAEATVARLTEPRPLRVRLWDGLRRIWSWLARALRRVAETGRNAIRLARDIAGYAFRAATEGLRHLMGALRAFVAHVGTAVRRRHTDPTARVSVTRETGRDVSLMTREGVSSDYVALFTEQLHTSAQILRRACQILGKAVGLGLSLAKVSVTGPLVLRVLIGAVRDLPGLLVAGREMQALRARYAVLSEALEG